LLKKIANINSRENAYGNSKFWEILTKTKYSQYKNSEFFKVLKSSALFENGDGRLSLEVIRREWGKIAALGLRTCPETDGWSRSAAHGWGASPAVYLPSYMLGVRPLEPGYRTFVVDPCHGGIEWARGSVATPHGPIYASWRRNEKGEVEIDCTPPPECHRVQGSDRAIK
jgi:hypothetical protein